MASPSSQPIRLGPGDCVKLTTSLGEEVTGLVYALDENTNTLVLRQPASTEDASSPPAPSNSAAGSNRLRFLNISSISTLEVEATSANGSSKDGQPGISVERLAKLENEARNRVEKDLKRINPKASPKAQFVFDTIAKIYDSRWQDVTIVILDQISLAPPYTRDEIKAIDPAVKPEFLDRIRTMVDGVSKKFDLKAAKAK